MRSFFDDDDYNRKKYSSLNSKPCPGPMFDWIKLKNFLANYGYSFNDSKDLIIQNITMGET